MGNHPRRDQEDPPDNRPGNDQEAPGPSPGEGSHKIAELFADERCSQAIRSFSR